MLAHKSKRRSTPRQDTKIAPGTLHEGITGWLHSRGDVSLYVLDARERMLRRYTHHSDPLPPPAEEFDLDGACMRAVGEIRKKNITIHAFELSLPAPQNAASSGRRRRRKRLLLAAHGVQEFSAWVSILRQTISGSNRLDLNALTKMPTPGSEGGSLTSSSTLLVEGSSLDASQNMLLSSCCSSSVGAAGGSPFCLSTTSTAMSSQVGGILQLERPSNELCQSVRSLLDGVIVRRRAVQGSVSSGSISSSLSHAGCDSLEGPSQDSLTQNQEWDGAEEYEDIEMEESNRVSGATESLTSGSITLQPISRAPLGECNVGTIVSLPPMRPPKTVPDRIEEAIEEGKREVLEAFINTYYHCEDAEDSEVDEGRAGSSLSAEGINGILSKGGLTLLCMAASSFAGSATAMIRLIIAAGGDVDGSASRHGRTALWHASKAGQYDAVVALLGAGAEVDSEDDSGVTPLCVACANGRELVASSLLEAGADPGRSDAHGITPLMTAAGQGFFDTVCILLERGGIDLEQRTMQGMSALYCSCLHASDRTISYLINSGARVNCSTNLGTTPLHIAAELGKTSVAQILLDAGAKVDALTMYQDTPLMCAVKEGHEDIVRLFLMRGADCALTDLAGKTPLEISQDRKFHAIETLLNSVVAADGSIATPCNSRDNDRMSGCFVPPPAPVR